MYLMKYNAFYYRGKGVTFIKVIVLPWVGSRTCSTGQVHKQVELPLYAMTLFSTGEW